MSKESQNNSSVAILQLELLDFHLNFFYKQTFQGTLHLLFINLSQSCNSQW